MAKFENRAFLGVWVPAHVWLNKDLDISEKCLFAEIESLWGSKNGCFASNKYLCEFLWCELRNLQYKLDKLKRLSLIRLEFTDNKRFLFVNPMQSIAPPHAIHCTPPMQSIAPPIIDERKDIDKSSFSLKEENKNNLENNWDVCSIEELRECVKMLVAKEEVPWRDTETCLSDWWLYCEMKGYRIKKRSAHLWFMKYLRGWDKKKMEEERIAYESKKNRRQNTETLDDSRNKEKMELDEKERKANEYIRQNPTKLLEIEEIAYSRALDITKWNQTTAMMLKKLLIKKIAYEFSIS